MRIKRLELNNFRNFEKASFEFLTNFTVIIGENGKGKSSILQGLRLSAGTFLLGIDEADRYHILKEDIRRIDLNNRFVPQKNCYFSALGMIADREIHWKRSIAKPGGRTDIKEAYELIDIAKELNDAVNENMREDVDLPVIGFFSTARLWVEPKQTIKLKKKGSRLRDGYSRCLGDRSDKKSPMEWIKSASWKKLKEKPEGVLLDAVLEAIDTCVQNWKPTEWDEDSDDLGGHFTNDRGEKNFLPLFYLSDGLRTMAAMVAEIAYRCVILNAHWGREAVKLSKGIVLIDELDMHIHPKWQQHVVSDLKQAFPNIQFIATTHSPFIVQSLKSEELINLDRWTDVDPLDLTINEVSTSVMGLPGEYGSENQRIETLSKEYLSILEDQTKKEGKGELLNKLEKDISDPAVRAFLSLQRLKSKI
jgi:predicted ATP-binding protein involved in virulence